jgi:hypothetical protein
LWFFPVDCDGAFASQDGVEYGLGADRLDPASINPHHPLFHAFALLLTRPLRALGVDHAGHVAVRILSGLGGAWLLLQICACAGRGRALAGAAFALPVLASRGFVVEAAAGETILPGVAAAVFALGLAAKSGARLTAVGAALTFAVLLRQDNVLVAPGVAAALWLARPAGTRAAAVAMTVGGAGLATVAGYGIAWMVAMRGNMPFFDWITWITRLGPWGRADEFGPRSFGIYFTSLLDSMIGAFRPADEIRPWLGIAHLAPFAAGAVLLRGSRPRLALLVPAAVTIAVWAVLHAWFLPSNWEYLIAPTALVAAAASGLAAGEPATPRAARLAGALLLVVFAAWLLAAHGPYTARLRERRLAEAIAEARREDPGETRWLAAGHRAKLGLDLAGVPAEGIAVERTLDDIFGQIVAALRRSPATALLITDRFALDGQPRSYREAPRLPLDSMPDPPRAKLLRREGLVYGVRFEPVDAAASAPDSR